MSPPAAGRRERFALHLVQLGLLAVVVIALPYKTFDLDRFFVPKELVLYVVAALGALLCLGQRRRLELTLVDVLLGAFLGLSAISAIFAQNWWIAGRALALSIAGILLYWVGISLRVAGFRRQVLSAVAVAVVLGAATALIQAYAGPVTELFSLNRAPGGTFGNRNFMAHLAAIGAPAVVIATLAARTKGGFLLGAIGTLLLAAALVMSRSRAAWLAMIIAGGTIAVIGFTSRVSLSGGRSADRLKALFIAVVLGVAGATFLPNQLEWKSASPYLDSVRGVVNYKEGSGAGRLVQYRNSLEMSVAHPLLGVGPGNWPVEYIKFAERRDPSLSNAGGMTDNPWPSSDWVAFVSERGALATGCLLLAMLILGLRSLREIGEAKRTNDTERATAALTLIGTLVTTVVVGLFDAVLLIAIPTMFMWLVLGVLSPAMPTRRAVESPIRQFAAPALVAFGLAAAGRSAMQIEAMAIYNGASRLSTVEKAKSYDPGSYRIRMRLAEGYASRGDCAKASAEARAARGLFPNATDPRSVLRRCGAK
jgi:O-antigen ligase